MRGTKTAYQTRSQNGTGVYRRSVSHTLYDLTPSLAPPGLPPLHAGEGAARRASAEWG